MRLMMCGIFLTISLTGCASCKGTTFWGYGRYKDKEVEIESHGPLKGVVDILSSIVTLTKTLMSKHNYSLHFL